ncbi:hypothetical protein LSM04_003056 [Trypanosoma melophagium]|uniref:uncharacterized protein n=1 Tax=Trypanosoma melophagium TaxID=715481 RepID=UPI00351A54EB|nr:hypothetical protein LSM04_003056 [Trypanosoma melophagium]
MTSTPRYNFEPPPQLYVGVDYRWDPLYFRIPSPRGPVTSTRDENSDQLRVTYTSSTIRSEPQRLDDADKSPQRISQGKKFSSSRTRKLNQSDKITDKKSESSSLPNVGLLQRDTTNSEVERKDRIISPRISSKESPRHPPSSASRTTNIKKSGFTTHRDKLSIHCNDGPIHSPRLTRSAILRRDFNAPDKAENKPCVSPRETNRLFFDSQCKSLSNRFVTTSSPKTSGFSSQCPTKTDNALRHSNYHTKSGDILISPRGTKATSLRAAHTWSKLDAATLNSVSVASPLPFVRMEWDTKTPLSTVEKNLNRYGDHLRRRGGPPIPEFQDILPRSREAKNMKTKSDVGKKENDGEVYNTVSVSIVQLMQQKAFNPVVTQDNQPMHPVSDQPNSSHGVGGISPLSITIEEDQSSTNFLNRRKEENLCFCSPIENKEEFSLKKVEKDHKNGTNSSQDDSMEVEFKKQKDLSLQDAKFVLDEISADVREGTIPPVDIVEATCSFSSSAFSEATDVTPCSVSTDEREVLATPPSYWRAETLPMVEPRPTNSLPSEVNAEEAMNSPMETEKSKQGLCAPTISVLPPISETELAEKISSTPPYILMGNMAPKVVKAARVTTSNTLQKYMKLRQSVRLHTMGVFFRSWLDRLSKVGFLKTNKVVDTIFFSSSSSPSSPSAGAARSGGGVITCGSSTPSDKSVVAIELALTPNESEPPVGTTAAEQQVSNVEEIKTPKPECCYVAAEVTFSVREKSSPPLSKRALEEANSQLLVYENGTHDQTTAVDKKYSLDMESSSFHSSSETSREELSAVEWDSPLAIDRDPPETDWLSVDFTRPTRPINYDIRGIESMHSHRSSASHNSTATVSEEDSKRTTDLEELISNHNDHVNPPHIIKYLHYGL